MPDSDFGLAVWVIDQLYQNDKDYSVLQQAHWKVASTQPPKRKKIKLRSSTLKVQALTVDVSG
ncbi:hypothetical protein PanWU01x14_204180 [Parasponia andersonii]|uniref:Uncharacterized protein n=1 Tax=Parasponia andersonii TaxID=3476 RepID=A0A2P5BWN6_PARAD|nr:hypothetical protein PanWU01x14_204180 [Parasponia andersonii]